MRRGLDCLKAAQVVIGRVLTQATQVCSPRVNGIKSKFSQGDYKRTVNVEQMFTAGHTGAGEYALRYLVFKQPCLSLSNSHDIIVGSQY